MTGKEFELIRTELSLNQTRIGELLEKGKDTICRIEAKKQVPEIYRLAILQLKREIIDSCANN
jgi:DNA-binding XRE family transcriptional regulator